MINEYLRANFKKMHRVALCSAMTGLMVATGTAKAETENKSVTQAEASPAIQQTQFKDWVVLCSTKAEQKSCQMVQTLSVEQGEVKQRVLQATIVQQGEQRLLEITVPLGVDLRPGILIQVDENPVGAVPYLSCNPGGCSAVVNLDDAFWRQLRAGKKAKVGVRGLGQSENTVLELSLQGFTAASNALVAK